MDAPSPQPYAAPGPYANPYASPPAPLSATTTTGPSAGSRTGSRTAIWLAGSALGIAAIALVVAVIALVLGMSRAFDGSGLDFESLAGVHGEVVGTPASQPISGERIDEAVTTALLAAGASVDDITCPDLISLQPGASVTCTGTVDGDPQWSGWVVFSGVNGEFDVRES